MAKQRTDTESVLRLVIDGKQAKTSGKELGDTFRKLSTELNNMKEADNPSLYREKTAELKKVKEAWEAVRREINGTSNAVVELTSNDEGWAKSVLKIVKGGNSAKISMSELKDAVGIYSESLDKMRKADNPQLYKERVEGLKLLKRALDDSNKSLRDSGNEVDYLNQKFSSFKSEIVGLAKQAVGGLGIAGVFYGITNGVKQLVTVNAELSDSYGRVMKTTGLTEEAVDRLNTKFKKLDTRTANAELLGLAEVAGKLGISAEKDVEGFVRAADKIGVALGEDLGGVEESINSLGKLTDIFKVKDQFGLEDSLLKVGSAINTLGASGTANEKNLVDFANRLAGVAPAAGLTIDQVLGLAAVQDELGQSMESSSTAIGQFIVQLGANIPKYAKVAGMSVKDFSKLLKENANEAFLRVLEAARSTGGGLERLAKNMGILEISGTRGIAALGAMADNIDLVRRRQQESSEAFDEGTSVLDEFNTMNNTLGANLDKIWNKLSNMWQNSSFRDWLTDLTKVVADSRTGFERANEEYDQARIALEKTEKQINPLLQEYERLNGITNKSKVQQAELRMVIDQIAASYPIAAGEMDKYGNVISINTSKIRGLIDAERELLKIKNEDAISSGLNQLAFQQRKVTELQEQLATGYKTVRLGGHKDGFDQVMPLSNKERLDIQRELDEATTRLRALQLNLSNLGHKISVTNTEAEQRELRAGEARFDALKVRYEDILTKKKSNIRLTAEELELERKYLEATKQLKKPDEGTGLTASPSKADEKAAEREKKEAERRIEQAADLFKKLGDQTAEFGQTQLMEQMSKNDKEVEQEKAKYQKLMREWEEFQTKRAEALGTTDQDKLLKDADYVTAMGHIALLEEQQRESVLALRVKQEAETTKKIEDLRLNLANKHASELQKEKDRINKFYDDLEKENAGSDAVIAKLKTDRAKDIADATIREEQRIHDETKRLQAETVEFGGDKYSNRLAKIQASYSAELLALQTKFDAELLETEAFEQAKAALKAKYGAQEKQIEIEKSRQIKDAAVEGAQIIADAAFAIQANNRNAELQATLSNLDKQREQELSNKRLTEEQKTAINKKYDDIARKEKLKAWKADQKAAIIQGAINTALAVTKALPNFILAGVAAAAGAAQVAVIASQKPPQFAKGGLIPQGPRHSQGGIDLVDRRNRIIANMEGGEPILSRATYANNREIVDALIYSGQRRNGAAISLHPDLINAEQYVRNGGMQFQGSTQTVNSAMPAAPAFDMDGLVQAIDRMVDGKIQRIQVELPFHVLEERQNKVVKIRDSVNA